jgi:hypothetical protein
MVAVAPKRNHAWLLVGQVQHLVNADSTVTENDTVQAVNNSRPRQVISYWKPLLTMYMLDDHTPYIVSKLDPVVATGMLVRRSAAGSACACVRVSVGRCPALN